MPRARANIRAKFRAQIETGVNLVVITSAPAATSSPAMVSSRGSPAATRLPNAMTRMMIVTGHDSISDLSMADRLALLKLAHRALSPVRVTLTAAVDRAASFGCTASAASTILLESPAAPAVMMAVRPSLEIETPACGGTTVGHAGVAAEHAGRLGHGGLRPGVGRDRAVMVDDHDLQARRPEAGEVLLDDRPVRRRTDCSMPAIPPRRVRSRRGRRRTRRRRGPGAMR